MAPGGSNPVMAMYRGPDGVLWAAGTRLYRRDANSEWHCVPLHPGAGAASITVNTLTTDGRGGLRLGTRTGLWRYAKDGTLTLVEGTGSRNVTVLFVPVGRRRHAIRRHDLVRRRRWSGQAPG